MAVNPYDIGSGPDSSGQKPATRWYVYLEDALILLAIPALWFTVLRKTGPVAFGVQVVTLIVMLVVAFVRSRRLLVARREAEEDARRL